MPDRESNPAWRRLQRAFQPRLSRSQVAGAVLLALLGFAAVTQVRAFNVEEDYQRATTPQLIQMLDGLNQRSERLEGEISDLREARASLRSGADQSQTAIEQAEERAATLGILAGTLPATGSGATIIISDPRGDVTASLLLNAIQELRDAGAEAIEINDEVRVVAESYVVDHRAGIVVDGVALSAPYTIEAIGTPDTLVKAMHIPGGVVDEVSQKQGVATVTEQQDIDIESTHELPERQHASPAPAEDDDG